MREIRQAPTDRAENSREESWEKVARGEGISNDPLFRLSRDSEAARINATHCVTGFPSTWIYEGRTEFRWNEAVDLEAVTREILSTDDNLLSLSLCRLDWIGRIDEEQVEKVTWVGRSFDKFYLASGRTFLFFFGWTKSRGEKKKKDKRRGLIRDWPETTKFN